MINVKKALVLNKVKGERGDNYVCVLFQMHPI